MSVYILFDYIKWCKVKNLSPNPKDLKFYKSKFWREQGVKYE